MTATPARPVVLTLLGACWPGHGSSGPNLSYRALVRALGEEFEFRHVARDRPFGAAAPIVENGQWVDEAAGSACYCAPGVLGASGLGPILRETPHELLVLNGFFDRDFTLPALLLRRLGRVPARPTILSPRGEFSGGALGLKAWRKSAWLALAQRLELLADVTLHATSESELKDIRRGFPFAADYVVAPNLRELVGAPSAGGCDGRLRVIFVGRISRVKNLDLALRVLAEVGVPLAFEIYGPVGDAGYWAECQRLIGALPINISVSYRGEIPNEEVPAALASADLLFLPSKSENFGHAMFEALSCGVPLLIGDQTPWRDLVRLEAGWDLPLDDSSAFAEAIRTVASASGEDRARWREGARRLAERSVNMSDALAKNRFMFQKAIAGGKSKKE